MLIQTISRVNRKHAGKEYGLIVDYIGIRDNMREAMKIYGGDSSVAPTSDDVEQATEVFRDELAILQQLFVGYDLRPFLDPAGDPAERYRLLAKAAEYVFISTQALQTESKNGKSISTVSFKTYFLKTVKRMRAAYDICQPSGELSEEESALAQCFMAIAGFVRKMSGTSEVDADTMNRHVAKMVEEALKYNSPLVSSCDSHPLRSFFFFLLPLYDNIELLSKICLYYRHNLLYRVCKKIRSILFPPCSKQD